jgi:hypothetical protein
MTYAGVRTTYVGNPMGRLTASALSTAMAAVPMPSSIGIITSLGAPVSNVSSVNGNGQAQLDTTWIFTNRFLIRFPQTSDQGAPFYGFFAAALRASLAHPVLEKSVTLLLAATGTTSVNPTSGTSTTATATLTGPAGSPVPTGTVQFTVNGTPSGGQVSLVNGQAQATLSFSTGGTYVIGFTYSGDSTYAPITVNTIAQFQPTTATFTRLT